MWQTPPSRRFLAGGIVLLLLIAGGIFLWLNPFQRATPANFASYFPAREATVFYIDVAAIRASGIMEKLVGATVGEDAEYKTFVQQTGFDYKRDLNQVMLNSAGGVHYFVLQGHFDWDKLRSYATSQGGQCKDDYCHMKGSTPERVISWKKLRRDMMALASSRDEAGARAIERRGNEAPGFEVPNAPVWLHVPAEAIRSAGMLPAGTRVFVKALEPAERAVFTLAPENDQFALAMDVVCKSAEDAAVMKAQMEGVTKLLTSLIAREKKAPSASDLSGVLTSGSFERLDRHVKGHWAVRRAFLDSLGGS